MSFYFTTNVVGFNTVTVNKQWSIFSVNFEKVSGGSLTINDAFPYADGMTKGNGVTGDQIQVQNAAGGYDTYYLSDGNFTQKGKTTYYADRDGKWFKGTQTSASADELKPGQAYWYGAKQYTTPWTMTVAGVVPASATKTFAIDKQWCHIANPYPVALTLNSMLGCQEGMTKGNGVTGDQIQIQNAAGGYDTYYLSDGNFTQKGKTTYYADRDGKWFKGTQTSATTDAIPVGLGAWYGRKGANDFDITITNPVD